MTNPDLCLPRTWHKRPTPVTALVVPPQSEPAYEERRAALEAILKETGVTWQRVPLISMPEAGPCYRIINHPGNSILARPGDVLVWGATMGFQVRNATYFLTEYEPA